MLNSSLIIKTCARRVANMTSSFNAANRALAIPALAANQPSTNKISSTKKSVFSSRHLTRSFHNQRPAFLPADAIYGDQGIIRWRRFYSLSLQISKLIIFIPSPTIKKIKLGISSLIHIISVDTSRSSQSSGCGSHTKLSPQSTKNFVR